MGQVLNIRNANARTMLTIALECRRDYHDDTMLDGLPVRADDVEKLTGLCQSDIEQSLHDGLSQFNSQSSAVVEIEVLLALLDPKIIPRSSDSFSIPIRNEIAVGEVIAALEVHRDMTNDTKLDGLPTSLTEIRRIGAMANITEADELLNEGRTVLNEAVKMLVEVELLLVQLRPNPSH